MAAVAVQNAQLYEELRTANHRKNEFLAMLAHELRNPLAPIRNALELMQLSDDEPDRRRESRTIIGPAGRRRWSGWSTTCWTSRASAAARSSCGRSRRRCSP